MSESPIHEEKYKGLTIKIFRDDDAQNPRENDNLATMLCRRDGRSSYGDDHGLARDEIIAYVKRKDVISLPLLVYEHGGSTMRTTSFSCRWDSGQAGFIVVTKERVKAEMARPTKLLKDGVNHKLVPIKVITKKDLERVYALLRAEVEEYDNYLTGNVFGYVIEDKNGKQLDSVWGFFGDYNDGALKEAQSYVDSVTNNGTTDHEGQELLPLAVAAL
jgi:hypothetical protein